MLARQVHNGLTWIDLESPTRSEIVQVATEFNLDTFVAEELLLPSTRPRAEFHSTYAFVILHFPALRHSHKSRQQEVDFVIGDKFIITTHYDTIDPLHKFAKVFEVNSMLDTSNITDHGGFVFFYMMKKFYKSVEHELEYIRHEIDVIQDHIFMNHQVQMVEVISRTARDLLNLRQSIEPHRDVLKTLEDNAQFFGENFGQFLRALSNEYYRVHNHTMRSTDFLHELRETNNSLLTTRQNETMRVLTIMALFTFPLALFVAIFDMHTHGNPIESSRNGFWIVLGLLASIGVFMLWFFKKKEWL